MKTKIFNFRPLLFITLSILMGLLLSYFIILKNITGIIVLASFMLMVFVFILIRIKKLTKKHFITLFICLIACMLSVMYCNIKFTSYKVNDISTSEITGYVQQVNSSYILLTNVKVNNQKLSKNVSLYLNDSNSILEGDYIKFESKLYATKLVEDGQLNLSMLTYNSAYRTYISSDNIEVVNNNPNLKMKIKSYTYENLSKYYSQRNSAIVYAMIFGDKTFLNEFDITSYNNIGIAHIFAVSGLHITILFGAISYLLRKLKVNNKINFILLIVFALFYCYICNFSVSVVRATVMGLAIVYAKIIKKQPDSLNALCIAFIILTVINPINYLLKGFQLSFLCVLSILSFSRPIKNIFKFLPDIVASALSVSLSAMIGTSLTIISIYGSLNFLTALFNIVLIPIFSIIFVLIFVFTILTLIIPYISAINVVPNAILNIYNIFVDKFAKINSIVSLNNLGSICAVLFIAFIFIAGNFCILKLKPKIICSVIIFAFCVCSAIFNIIPPTYNTNSLITIRSKYDNCFLLTTKNDNRIIVLNTLNGYTLSTLNSYISRHNITRIDTVLTNNIELSSEEYKNFTSQLNCEIIGLTDYFYEYEVKKLYNINISVTSQTSMKKCFVLSIEDKNILFCFKKLNMAEQDDLQLNYSSFYAIISKNINYTNFEELKISYYNDNQENVISSMQQNFFTLKI